MAKSTILEVDSKPTNPMNWIMCFVITLAIGYLSYDWLIRLNPSLMTKIGGIAQRTVFKIYQEYVTNINLLWLASVISSGLIGFGTCMQAIRHVPDKSTTNFLRPCAPTVVAVRNGLRRVKTIHGRSKPKKRYHVDRKPTKPSQELIDAGYDHHHRFHNVPRTNRYVPPHIKRIRHKMVEDIQRLERKIEVAKKRLQILMTALRTSKAKLRKFDQAHNLKGSGKWTHAMQRELQALEDYKTNVQTQKPDTQVTRKKPKGYVTSWNTVMMCTFGKLVNLSKISSSGPKNCHEQVLFDSGANVCITNNKEDFVGELHSVKGESVDGIGKTLTIEGKEKIAWTFEAINGTYRTIIVPGFYIPTANARVASLRSDKAFLELMSALVTCSQAQAS